MNAHNKSQAATVNQHTSILQYHGSNIAVEEINGVLMFNATQMAKPFGKSKRPKEWLRTQQAKDLVKTVSKVHKCPLTDLQQVRYGGNNAGTWFQEDVALFFAQWLSPEFYLACNTKLKEVITKQAMSVETKFGVNAVNLDGVWMYPYTEIVRAVGGPAESSPTRRKRKHPLYFKKAFGRNFVTAHYCDLLNSYYQYKKAQLSFDFEQKMFDDMSADIEKANVKSVNNSLK